MIIYVTIAADAVVQEENGKIVKVLKELKYQSNLLGTYISRDYSTLVIEVDNLSSNDGYISIKEKIESTCKVLELDNNMKFYYLIKQGYALKEINNEIKNVLNNKSIECKIYNSHSQDGIFYVGLKIPNMNPFDITKVTELTNLVKGTEGVLELIKY